MAKRKEPPQHFYMVAAEVVYRRDDETRSRKLNLVIQNQRKQLTFSNLSEARRGAFERLKLELNVGPEDVLDIVFLTFSYLGLMPPELFYDAPEQKEPTIQ